MIESLPAEVNFANLQDFPDDLEETVKKKIPSKEEQERALERVKEVSAEYSTLLRNHRALWSSLFKATYVFETERKGAGLSEIFFPKCFEQVEKIAPRLTRSNPKFVIGMSTPVHAGNPAINMAEAVRSAQQSLNYWWKIGGCKKKLRTWSKGGLVNGVMFAGIDFVRKTHKKRVSEIKVRPDGTPVEKITEKEELLCEYPTFYVPDILDILFDPRVDSVDDMKAIIENKDQVRKSDILANKDEYFNLDEVMKLSTGEFASNDDNQKLNKFNQQGIPTVDKGNTESFLNYKKFSGYFSPTGKPEDEELYKIITVADSVVIQCEPIEFMPYEMFVPIEIPNQGAGKGVVEPVKQLQDAYNLTRNQRFENVSIVLNRMWLMKQGAGIDPRKLVSRAGNIIVTKDLDALKPLETNDVTASSYNEANAINTDIQTTLGTIDATQDSNDQGFTNLATGQKIRWNEYNSRFGAIKENLEESLARLGEKMLRMVGERAEQNPLIEDQQTKQFYEVAKEIFDDVSDFYNVSVLANSTSSDSVDDARDEALGIWQLMLTAKAQGLPINLQEQFKNIMETFPGFDTSKLFMETPAPMPMGGGQAPQVPGMETPMEAEAAMNKSLTTIPNV